MTEYEVMGSHCNNESQTSKKKLGEKGGNENKPEKKMKRSQANKMLRFLCNKQFQIFSH